MTKKEIDEIISKTLNIALPLPEDLSSLNCPSWDSIVFMTLLEIFEEKTNKKIKPFEAMNLYSLKGFYELFLEKN